MPPHWPDTTTGATHQNQIEPEKRTGGGEKNWQPNDVDGSQRPGNQQPPSGPPMAALNTQRALTRGRRRSGRDRTFLRRSQPCIQTDHTK